MPLISRNLASAMLAAACFMFGCGKKEADISDRNASVKAVPESPPADSVPAAATTGNAVSAPLTADDIGRWDKGIAGEMKAIEEAGAKLKTARTGEDTLSAMMGVQETSTVAAGAQAAGLELERYKFVRSNLSGVVKYLTPSQGGIDTTLLSPAQRDEMRRMNESQIQQMQEAVPADVVEALKPRAVELRKKDMELVGARLKGAGM